LGTAPIPDYKLRLVVSVVNIDRKWIARITVLGRLMKVALVLLLAVSTAAQNEAKAGSVSWADSSSSGESAPSTNSHSQRL